MKHLMIRGIELYQKHLSPRKSVRCPYTPTCSAYALQAIERYGACKGTWLAIKRIARCHPYHEGGYDAVP